MGRRALVGIPTPLLFTLSGVWCVSFASLITAGFHNVLLLPFLASIALSSVAMLVFTPVAAYALVTNRELRTPAQWVRLGLCVLCLLSCFLILMVGHLAWGIR